MAKSKQGKRSKKKAPTLRQSWAAYLAAQCSVIIDGVPRLREREGYVDSAAAIRRLRAAVADSSELDLARSGGLDEDLVWHATALDRLVDLDAAEVRITEAIDAEPAELVVGRVAAQLQTELQAERQQVWERLLADLDGDRIHQLLARLHTWRSDPPFTADADAAGTIKGRRKRAQGRLERRTDTARAALAHDPHAAQPDTIAALERARAAESRLLVVLEISHGGPVGEQSVLEEHRVSRLTADLLRHEGIRIGVRSGHNGFSYGLLYALERVRQRELAASI